jgi:hypothetical protein
MSWVPAWSGPSWRAWPTPTGPANRWRRASTPTSAGPPGRDRRFRVLFAEHNRADPVLATAIEKVESAVADRVAGFIEVEGLSDDERQVLAYGVVGLAESTSRHWLTLGLGPGYRRRRLRLPGGPTGLVRASAASGRDNI